MGYVPPYCLCSDNVRLYGLSYHFDTVTGKIFYVLIKSNDNPSFDLKTLSWSLISVVPTVGLATLDDAEISPTNYNCAIDDTGVFSFILRFKNTRASGGAQYHGMQYIPSPTGTAGSGTWRNITVPQEYPFQGHGTLFNFKDSQGKNNLMHNFSSSKNMNLLVAAMDPSTLTMNLGPPWNI
ncbi:hypothetical protein BX616_003526, partial [Lobosporangium transversale]